MDWAKITARRDEEYLQYIPRNMHTVFALLCFVVVIHWLIFPYPSGLLHWHFGNLTIAPVPAKQPWWIWINTSYEFIMNDCITTTKQSTTKPCAYFLGYTVSSGTHLLHFHSARWKGVFAKFLRSCQEWIRKFITWVCFYNLVSDLVHWLSILKSRILVGVQLISPIAFKITSRANNC